jgi:hypothetical protein
MNCHELREGFELYALGLLEEGEEKAAITAHLEQGCLACRAHMQDALAVQALMLSQAPDVLPPMRLKRRVLGAVGIQPMGWTWFAAACAAAMLVTALWYGVIASERRRQRDEARASLAEVTQERDALQSVFRFVEDPQTKQFSFGDPQAQPPRGNVFLNPRFGVLLIAANLTPAAADRAYQVWILPKTGAARPAGKFRPDAEGSVTHTFDQPLDLNDVSGVAITVESSAGSPAPTMPMLLLAKIG